VLSLAILCSVLQETCKIYKCTIFWDVMPCSVVEAHQLFRGMYRLHHWGHRESHYINTEILYMMTFSDTPLDPSVSSMSSGSFYICFLMSCYLMRSPAHICARLSHAHTVDGLKNGSGIRERKIIHMHTVAWILQISEQKHQYILPSIEWSISLFLNHIL
jgi:hypothetical protein